MKKGVNSLAANFITVAQLYGESLRGNLHYQFKIYRMLKRIVDKIINSGEKEIFYQKLIDDENAGGENSYFSPCIIMANTY